ncbi:Kinetochore protein mis15 [Penicillium rolfsii]|nr:Kinetochore protein mis15 [Penicillium rolfsii]
MARAKTLRAPTTASLPNNLRIPSTTPSLAKSLSKHSRQALLDLALLWLDDRNIASFPPYLQSNAQNDTSDEETLPYPAAETIEDIREAYIDLQYRKGAKREVLERILEGDWRHGITLRQLAMADLRYMDDHPSSLRWTALELSRIDATQKKPTGTSIPDWSTSIPRTQAATFVRALQQEISPLVKAHYHLSRSSSLPLTFLRIFVLDTPYQAPRQTPEVFADSSRVIYVAFPDSCPFIYTSVSTSTGSKPTSSTSSVATDPRSLQRLVREAVPKALSRPHERYTLKATALAAKSLLTLLALRGPGRTTAANGAFSIFADAAIEGSPLDPRPSNTVSAEEHMRLDSKIASTEDDKENENHTNDTGAASKRQKTGTDSTGDGHLSPTSKKRRLATCSRFGTAGGSHAPAPLDRLDIRLLDAPSSDNGDSATAALPTLSLTFTGTDVIAGIRQLAALGVIDPERMPSWMTGEEAVSMAVIRGGKRMKNSA